VESKIDPQYYRLRARHPDYQQRELTLVRLLRARLNERCYVSWSAGKDSMLVAHACQSILPAIPILMVDPGVPIHWTEGDRANVLGYTQFNRWAKVLFPWEKFTGPTSNNEAEYRKQVHASMFHDLHAYAESIGCTKRVTGIRREESKGRARVAAQTANTLQPIADWSADDVWTYTIKHDLPWLSIYDHLGPLARNGLIGKNGREHGRMAFLKLHYPEAFREACDLFNARDFA
jgi:3'-phosphoadenosine 5'-phosphosulfate sulfotransferase (PAPS reductase)/FAD synthetase